MTAPPGTGVPAVNGYHPEGADVDEQPPAYSALEPWVNGYFSLMFLHRAADSARVYWCTQWWDHPEAIARLMVLWTTWEAARWDPAAMPAWWLELDHHLPILLGPDGPLRLCRIAHSGRAAKHEVAEAPANEPAPPGWWD